MTLAAITIPSSSINFESILPETGLTVSSVMACILTSVLLGFLVSTVYMLSDSKKKYSANFAITLVVLPILVSLIIMLVGSDYARAFSVAGAFTLIRFRSVPGDSRDITSVFFAMGVGLAAGMGYLSLAITMTILVGIIYVALMRSPYARNGSEKKMLRITIPENLNYEDTFDEIFQEFTSRTDLDRVRTTNLGALYELTYTVIMKPQTSQKDFIDKLRCRNGNLNIILGMLPDKNQEL